MGPFCVVECTSSHETIINLAPTDKMAILLTDEVSVVDMLGQDNSCKT